MYTVKIKKHTMNIDGGIVRQGQRYYTVTITDLDNGDGDVKYYPTADMIPVVDLLRRAGSDISNISWPNKRRDLRGTGAITIIGRMFEETAAHAADQAKIDFRELIRMRMGELGIPSGYALAKKLDHAITVTAIDNFLAGRSQMTAANLALVLDSLDVKVG